MPGTTPIPTSGLSSITSAFSNLGSNIVSGLGDLASGLFGTQAKPELYMRKGTDNNYAYGSLSDMGEGAEKVTGASYDNMTGAQIQAATDAAKALQPQAQSGLGGFASKLLTPEGMLMGAQAWTGWENHQMNKEKFEIAKRRQAKSDKEADERRAGRIALGRALHS